jgi:hypothetical protein
VRLAESGTAPITQIAPSRIRRASPPPDGTPQ